jgi:hypothetical protein
MSEEYRTERGFFGRHLTRPEEFLFSHCRLLTNGLSSWAAHLTGFQLEFHGKDRPNGWQYRLTYTAPRSIEVTLPDGLLRISVGARSTSTLREHSFQEEVAIIIKAKEPIPEEDWNNQFVYPLLNFLTLATGIPNALTSWDLSVSEGPTMDVKVVGQRIVGGSADEPSFTPHRMLLPLETLEPRLSDVVVQWLKVSSVYRNVCNIYFGLLYAPGAYVDMRLLGISQALELYQARRANAEASGLPGLPLEVLTSLPPKAQEELRHWAEVIIIDSFESTLMRLSDEHQTTLTPLAPQGLEALVKEITRFRNYALYRREFPEPRELFAYRLYLTAETLSCLMKSCFLAELGFTPTERASLFQSTASYNFLQGGWAATAQEGTNQPTDTPPVG